MWLTHGRLCLEHRQLRLTLTTAILLLASGTPSPAQNAGDRQLASYRAFIERYRSGDYAGAVDSAMAGSMRPASAVLALWTSRAVPDWIDRSFIETAALLHIDVAARLWRRDLYQDASSHVEVARRFAEASTTPSATGDGFRRRWYLGAALLHARHVAPNEATAFFERALQAAPDDIAILTAASWLHERLALLPGLNRGAALAAIEVTRDRHLAEAARLARVALATDPSATEASLRLGRVETERGHLVVASNILENVVAREATSAHERYIGLLLLGGVRERQGQREAAAANYQQAVTQWPEGQSARVALALVLRESGNLTGAGDIMTPLLSPRVERVRITDPWANYLLGPIPFGDLVLEALRVEVRRP